MIDAEVLDNDPIFDQSYAEIERLRAEKNVAWDSAEYNARRARKAETAIEKLREYARHKPGCYWRTGSIKQPQPCDCGYDALMADLEYNKSARLLSQAADEIDRLRTTIERLREALESIAGGEIYPVQVALDALMAEVEGTK